MYSISGHDYKFRISSVVVNYPHFFAITFFSTGQNAFAHYLVPRLKPFAILIVGADFDDSTGEFVSRHNRVLSHAIAIISQCSFIYLEVSAANANIINFDQNISGFHFRQGNFCQASFMLAFYKRRQIIFPKKYVLLVFFQVKSFVIEPALSTSFPLVVAKLQDFFEPPRRPVEKGMDNIIKQSYKEPEKSYPGLGGLFGPNSFGGNSP